MPDVNNTEGEEANNTKVQPEGETLLVKTHLRYGQLSKSDKDTMVRNEQWTPPDDLLSDISDRFKDVAEAYLEIYRVEETGVIRVKITETSFISAIAGFFSSLRTRITDNARQRIQWAWGAKAVAAGQTEEGVCRCQNLEVRISFTISIYVTCLHRGGKSPIRKGRVCSTSCVGLQNTYFGLT